VKRRIAKLLLAVRDEEDGRRVKRAPKFLGEGKIGRPVHTDALLVKSTST